MTFRLSRMAVLGVAIVLLGSTVVRAEDNRLVLDRGNGTIVLEPYGPNIMRVTLSTLKDKAAAGPGYGFSGAAAAAATGRSRNVELGGGAGPPCGRRLLLCLGDPAIRRGRAADESGLNHADLFLRRRAQR